MVLELSTGGSVQDMLEDPAKAPGGQLPMATVRPVRQIACFDPAFLVLVQHRPWLTQSIETNQLVTVNANCYVRLQALRIVRHTLSGLVSAHSRYRSPTPSQLHV